MNAQIELKPGRVQPVWLGHPWIFSGAISRIHGSPDPGALVQVTDPHKKLLGYGTYNPHSQIAVRMVTHREEPLDLSSKEPLASLLANRIQEAAERRRRLHLPNEKTNVFRLVNSEGDRIPGVVIDWYNGCAVVQFTTLAMKQREHLVYESLSSLPEPYKPQSIVEIAGGRFAQQEGFFATTRCVLGAFSLQDTITCREENIALEVSPGQGQKTGLFLDQRENRLWTGSLCRQARVLDIYTYTGGFALQALRHGAQEVVAVDSSERALQAAQHHAILNGFSSFRTDCMDAFRFLESVSPRSYDVVIVDPPKFASAQKDLSSALTAYRRLNTLAYNAVAPGGWLVSSSCSQHVESASFERMLASAALDAGRYATLVRLAFQGPDHPVLPSFPEGRYLKCAWLSVT